jgi:hypothetical protein
VSFLSDMTYTGFQFLSLAPMRRASSHWELSLSGHSRITSNGFLAQHFGMVL